MSSIGWFGKLAGVGDFASRRLPSRWVQRCDQWLSLCMQAGRVECDASGQPPGSFKAAWLASYLTAPLWAFVWAPEVIDDSGWRGMLMPSCDRVGRYFPLLLVEEIEGPCAAGAAESAAITPMRAAADIEWFDQLGHAALRTLEGRSLEDFEAQLSQIGEAGRDRLMAPAWTPASQSTCWWRWLPDQALGSPGCTAGLPTPAQFTAMLLGQAPCHPDHPGCG